MMRLFALTILSTFPRLMIMPVSTTVVCTIISVFLDSHPGYCSSIEAVYNGTLQSAVVSTEGTVHKSV
jgi:hypothetical protein